MQVTHIRQALIGAAAVLAGLPALAGTVFPGTMCTSEGPVGRGLNGLMVNKAVNPVSNDPMTTAFYCPITHSHAAGLSGQFTITVNVKTTDVNLEFACWIRSVLPNGVMHDQLKLSFGSTYSAGAYTSMANQISFPAVYQVSLNMRCLVPNIYQGSEAGIVSYSVQ